MILIKAKDKKVEKAKERAVQVNVMASDSLKKKLIGLYLGGMELKNIAKSIGCSYPTVTVCVKAYKAELAKLDATTIAALLRAKWLQASNAHDIQASELIQQTIALQSERDGLVTAGAKVTEDQVYKANRELRDIGSDWSKCNREFIDFVDRMGVPGMDGDSKNREPTQSPILLENSNMSKRDATLAMKSSLRRQLRALDKKDEEKDA